MKVQDIMTRQPKTASRATTLADAAQLLWSADCGVLPVVDAGRLVGVVTDRDLFIALAARDKAASQLTVGEVAKDTVWTCRPDDDVHVALKTMASHKVRRLPVSADGKLIGVISINDIVLAAGPGKGLKDDELVEAFKAICGHRAGPVTAVA